MSQELEIEFKNLLSQTEMMNLINHFNLSLNDFKTQVNIYFDTEDLTLKHHHCALRVRMKQNTFELTLKEPHEQGLLETNQLISTSEYNHLCEQGLLSKGEVYNQIKDYLQGQKLIELATLETNRYQLPYKGQELFLDISTYYDHIDYEIELETNEYQQGKKVFDSLLNEFKIPLRQADNKIKRAYHYKLLNHK